MASSHPPSRCSRCGSSDGFVPTSGSYPLFIPSWKCVCEKMSSLDRIRALYWGEGDVVAILQRGEFVEPRNSVMVATGNLHIVSAWNPLPAGNEESFPFVRTTKYMSLPTKLSDDENRKRNLELCNRLEGSGRWIVPARWSNSARTTLVEAFAVAGLTDGEALSYGRNFGQLCVIRIDDNGQSLLSCLWEHR